MAGIEALARQLRVKADGLTAEGIGKELARVARVEDAKIQAQYKPSETVVTVDGREGAPLDSAQRVIKYRYSYWADIIDTVYRMLVETSPVGPAEGGHYRDDHMLFVNGQRRDAGAEGAEVLIPQSAEVVFINTRPYARKIEGGMRFQNYVYGGAGHSGSRKTGGLSSQAPNGVYEITAKEAQRKFGQSVEVRFEYRRYMDGQAVSADVAVGVKGARGRRTTTGKGAGGRSRFPAIVLRMKK